jgi:hypothetical protein
MRGWILAIGCLLGLAPLSSFAQDTWEYEEESSFPLFALRADGFIGVAAVDRFDFGSDDTTFEGGGTGSVAFLLDSIYIQGDIFGDVRDYDGADTSVVGFVASGGWRDPESGRAGGALAYSAQEVDNSDFDVFRFGVDGEIFLDFVTFGAEMGYANIEISGSDDDAFYLDTGLDYYANDDLKLLGGVGVIAGGDIDNIALLHAGMEYYLGSDIPVSLFTRWEAGFSHFADTNSFVGGFRIYWGAEHPSLKSYDRAYFKESCAGFNFIGRIC